MDIDMKDVDDDRIRMVKTRCADIVTKIDKISILMHHRDSADQMTEIEMKQALELRHSLKEDVRLLEEWVDDLNML